MRIGAIGALSAAILLSCAPAAQARTPALPAGAAPPVAALASTGTVPSGVRDDAPAVTAPEAYLVDAASGEPLMAKRETRRVPVASLTKVMTAYVVRHRARLDDVITITKTDVRHAAANDATTAGLRPGERLTVRDLLYAMMLPSGADAAHALAQRYGPGVGGFVSRMNAAAKSLGMRDSRYANADGLPSSGYSTARDQALLARAALRDPVIAAVAKTRKRVIGKTAVHRSHTWRNTNKLLDEGALGLKTGYTHKAGYCLTFVSPLDDGRKVIGVLLGERSDVARFTTARALLEWASGGGLPE
ncbi:D-alanyl-D-alanine carboxypeptidase family protein [Microbispora corallina]|uniref:Peptidase n=1 Tax=Microbispora corallina TaxID=83302 RepID=A0ABQ4FWE5_9ACTN|nr:D-alanyl-D-alanine carboxypeptidase family protein [Microbispora corallina]GIH39126.1 peptidase [Microbispora corallina]